MDVIAHGIWSAIVFSGQPPRTARAAILWGVAPDLVPAAATAIALPVLGLTRAGFLAVYPFTHSLIIFAAVFLAVALVRRALPVPMLAWALHILVDMPGHQRFLTPFLFPLSDFRVMGWWEWLSPPMLAANYATIALVVVALWLRRRRVRAATVPAAAQAAASGGPGRSDR